MTNVFFSVVLFMQLRGALGSAGPDTDSEFSTQCLLQKKGSQLQKFHLGEVSSTFVWQRALRFHEGRSEEEILAGLPLLLLQSDIEEMADGIDVTKPIKSQAEKVFERIESRTDLHPDLTAHEVAAYKNRFALAVEKDVELEEKIEHRKPTRSELSSMVRQELSLQQPAVTEKVVQTINQQHRGFKAGKDKFNKDLTLEEYDQKLGALLDGIDKLGLKEPISTPNEVAFSISSSIAPQSFDGRKRWPGCAQNIGHVRDQGLCGSCWAQATVGVFNDRLCIVSKEEFKIELSAADMTACCPKTSGCQGGSPVYASDWLTSDGVVTGGDYPDRHTGSTCYPYPIADQDSRKHFHESVSAPQCRTKCSDLKYPGKYIKDKYFAAGRAYLVGTLLPHKSGKQNALWEQVKTEISTKGSVIMLYAATPDHLAYKSGIWDCPAGRANHGVKCIGYGVDKTSGNYITCVNSWNVDFGEEGLFRMQFPGNGCLFALLGLPVKWDGKNQESYSTHPRRPSSNSTSTLTSTSTSSSLSATGSTSTTSVISNISNASNSSSASATSTTTTITSLTTSTSTSSNSSTKEQEQDNGQNPSSTGMPIEDDNEREADVETTSASASSTSTTSIIDSATTVTSTFTSASTSTSTSVNTSALISTSTKEQEQDSNENQSGTDLPIEDDNEREADVETTSTSATTSSSASSSTSTSTFASSSSVTSTSTSIYVSTSTSTSNSTFILTSTSVRTEEEEIKDPSKTRRSDHSDKGIESKKSKLDVEDTAEDEDTEETHNNNDRAVTKETTTKVVTSIEGTSIEATTTQDNTTTYTAFTTTTTSDSVTGTMPIVKISIEATTSTTLMGDEQGNATQNSVTPLITSKENSKHKSKFDSDESARNGSGRVIPLCAAAWIYLVLVQYYSI